MEQKGGFELSQIFEYNEVNSFKKEQELLGDILESRKDVVGKINFKKTTFRNINFLDYYDQSCCSLQKQQCHNVTGVTNEGQNPKNHVCKRTDEKIV